jgi:hypothetical protein
MCLGCKLDSIGAGMGVHRVLVNAVMELLPSVKYTEFLEFLANGCRVLQLGFLYKPSYVSLLLMSPVRPTNQQSDRSLSFVLFYTVYRTL